MKAVLLRHLLITLLMATSAIAETKDGPTPPPEKSTLRSDKVVLPLDSDASRPTIQAKINGKGPFLFVLDTGAQGFVIYADLAKELGLHFRSNDHSVGGRYRFLDVLKKGSKRHAPICLSGTYGNYAVEAFEYHYETYSTDSNGSRTTHHHLL